MYPIASKRTEAVSVCKYNRNQNFIHMVKIWQISKTWVSLLNLSGSTWTYKCEGKSQSLRYSTIWYLKDHILYRLNFALEIIVLIHCSIPAECTFPYGDTSCWRATIRSPNFSFFSYFKEKGKRRKISISRTQ